NFAKVELSGTSRIDLLTDKEAVFSAYANNGEVVDLVEYEGAVGEFFRGSFERDNFVAFMAPTKAGKTFWLVDVAYRAVRQRKRVAFFEVGDLSERQIKMRFL